MNKSFKNLHTRRSTNNPGRVVWYEDDVSNELDRARYVARTPVKAYINEQRGKGLRFDICLSSLFHTTPLHDVKMNPHQLYNSFKQMIKLIKQLT